MALTVPGNKRSLHREVSFLYRCHVFIANQDNFLPKNKLSVNHSADANLYV